MKKIISLVLVIIMLTGTSAFAKFEVWPGPAAVPADVYHTPYSDSQFTTTYAPWLKNLHIMSKYEVDRGDIGGEAWQQIRAWDMSAINPDISYFITNTNGIWKTHTGGDHWYNVTNNIAGGYDAQAILCDNLDENIVYCSVSFSGVFRSKNGGQSWELILRNLSTLENDHPNGHLALDKEGNLYMGTGNGIYKLERKTDKLIPLKEHTEYAANTKFSYRDIEVSPDGMIIYASCRNNEDEPKIETGIYASFDGGKTWSLKGTDDKRRFTCLSIALYPEDPKVIYACGTMLDKETQKSDIYGLYVSEDGGDTWNLRYNFLYSEPKEGHDEGYSAFYYMEFGPKNADGIYDLYYHGANVCWPLRVSKDYGKTFTPVFTREDSIEMYGKRACSTYLGGKVFTGYLAQDYALDMTKPGRLFYSTGEGVLEYDNGTWTWKNSGFSGAGVTDIAMNNRGEMYVCAMDSGGYYTESGSFKDGGYPTFTATYVRNHGSKIEYNPHDDDHILLFAGQANGTDGYFGIRQSHDNGKTWDVPAKEHRLEHGEQMSGDGNATVLQWDNENPDIIYSSYHNSYDNGKTWVRNEYFILAVSPTNNKVQAGIKGKGKNAELYVTRDGGKTWNYLMPIDATNPQDAIIDMRDENTLWYTAKTVLYKIDLEKGESINVSSRFEFPGFYRIAQNPKNPEHMLLSTSSAGKTGIIYNDPNLHESLDGGETWHVVHGFFATSNCKGMCFYEDVVFVSTMSGVWIYDYKKFHEYLDSKITIRIDNKAVNFASKASITGGRVMLPMRELFEALGATVNYNAQTGEITASKDGKYVSLYAGNKTATVNGKEIEFDVAPYINDAGRTLIPIRLAAESLGLGVGWSEKERTVYIKNYLK